MNYHLTYSIFIDRLLHLCLHRYQAIVIGLNQISEKSNWIKERVSHCVFEVNIYIGGLLET